MPHAERVRLLVEENAWKNDLVLWVLPDAWREAMPHLLQGYVRCALMTYLMYLAVGAVWCYYTYWCFGDKLYSPGTIPTAADIVEQIRVSLWAIPLYSALPVFTEWLAEQGWTQAFPRVDNVGVAWGAAYLLLYMTAVEFGVYWMHRLLHDIPWAYRLLHHAHHKYNKEHTLSPFAGLAFHPLDGICQALPYTLSLFLCPMHFLTHELLLFMTAIWTTNIHDCLHGAVWPIMGAGYHLIHHTTYKENYGHYTVYMDALFGTLLTPEAHERRKGGKAS